MKTKIANTVYTQKELQRIGPAAAYIVRYFVRRKFTIAEMRNALDVAGQWLTEAETEVRA